MLSGRLLPQRTTTEWTAARVGRLTYRYDGRKHPVEKFLSNYISTDSHNDAAGMLPRGHSYSTATDHLDERLVHRHAQLAALAWTSTHFLAECVWHNEFRSSTARRDRRLARQTQLLRTRRVVGYFCAPKVPTDVV